MKKWGMLLLSIWLIVSGAVMLLKISLGSLGIILVILQIVVGVLLLLVGKKLDLFHYLAGLLLAIFLILQGLMILFNIAFDASGIILGILALVSAGFMLFGKKLNIAKNLGVLFLAIWLILTGLMLLINLGFSAMPLIMCILAILAGIFLLLKK